MNFKSKLNGNIIMAVAFLIGTTIYLTEALRLPVPDDRPGAGLFPLMLAAVMYIASSVILVRGIKHDKQLPAWERLKIPVILIGMIGLYVGMFYHFGYFGATFLFSFGVALVFGVGGGSKAKRLLLPVIIAVAATSIGFLLYEVIFDIRLPRGRW